MSPETMSPENLTISNEALAPGLRMDSQLPAPTPLQGSVLVLIQFDVCEEIRLDKLREIFGARTQPQPSFKHPSPGYVRYQRPPVLEPIEPLVLESGEQLQGQIKYYDYGVFSVVFELPFSGDWDKLVRLGSRWVWDVDFPLTRRASSRQKLERAAPALIKPYAEWLSEDYFIFHVREIAGNPTAEELVQNMVRASRKSSAAKPAQLSEGERNEILQSRISYYPNDLAVIGWNAAFLYDTEAGAETAIQLLEYANSQLLEFRHYDELLTRELEGVYDFAGNEGTGISGALAAGAGRHQTAHRPARCQRTHRACRQRHQVSQRHVFRAPLQARGLKVGVPDYKDLVTQKVQTAEELYRFMVDQFNQSRAFFLELMVVVILVIELIFFFRGHPI